MWAAIKRGVGGGETRGGTQEVGGPSSALRKRATTNVVAHFLSFFLPSPATNTCYTQTATITSSLASKREPEVVFFDISTCLSPPPPPSHPNASRRWSNLPFRRASHHHHLPHVQTRAGGGQFRRFDAPPTTTTTLASKREPEVGFFVGFDTTPTATTSLTSKREPEVVIFASFKATATTTTSLASKRELEVVHFAISTCLPPLPPPSHPNASWRWSFSAVSRHLPLPPHHYHPQIDNGENG